ncbi:RebB family R body protein, partial [Pseudomonas aeruginosa]|nr:RebB family R body protein [Pseudomonas aeruginosa]
MAHPTAVNAPTTEAVTHTNIQVVDEAPPQSIVPHYQIASHSAG